VAGLKRDLILKKTMAGLEAARPRGRKDERKSAMDDRKISLASELMREGETSICEVCLAEGVSLATLHRYVRLYGTPRGKEEHSG
jgi:DNA invertase Pin-like site-specific DNA recombinase